MKILPKTVFIIVVVHCSLIIFFSLVSWPLLMSGYLDLEEKETIDEVQQALKALDDDLSRIEVMNNDWSAWDDTVLFVEGDDDNYIEENLNNWVFANLQLDMMLFYNDTGSLVYGKYYDLDQGTSRSLPPWVDGVISSDPLMTRHTSVTDSITGLLSTPEGLMLISSRPITNNEGEGPLHGTLVMSRFFDAAEIERLAGSTHLSLSLQAYRDPAIPDAMRDALAVPESIGISVQGEKTIRGSTVLRDIHGEPLAVMTVDLPRQIYHQGKEALIYLYFSLLVIALVFELLMIFLLGKVILSRIADLNASVTGIGVQNLASYRVREDGNDEITSLARGINGMVGDLAAHQHTLEALVEARTADLRKTNTLLQREIAERKELEEQKKVAYEQIEQNIEQFAILGDHIRNPLAVIIGLSDLKGDPRSSRIVEQARIIDRIVDQLDHGWIESEKIRDFLKKYYGCGHPGEDKNTL
jgi:sensor domain CHASE-containing protein